MFLSEKAAAPLTLRFFSSKNSHPSSFPSLPFDQALIAGLHSLLPIPNSSSSIPLPWLCRAVDFLALILSDAAALISDPSLSGSDRAALAAYIDSGIALLDACNAVTAYTDRLLRRNLLLRFALHLLSSPDSLRRARDAIAEWDRDRPPRRAIHDTADMLVRSLAPGDLPRGNLSAVRRAIYAVEAASSLVAAAVIAVLGGGEKGDFAGISVSSEFPWAEAFNKVAEAVSSRLGEGVAGEVDAVEASVRQLAAVIDGEDGGEKTETLRSAVKDAVKAAEEMKDGLDRLSNAVNGLFRAALRTRNTVLQSCRIALQKCK